ncbi:MAG: class I SAM-dependent methyltransferase [Thermoproteota archaeon]|nr:class I SAM-dependent methyltransferase [Thermoproteota archaeon]
MKKPRQIVNYGRLFKLFNEKVSLPSRFQRLSAILNLFLKGSNEILDVGSRYGRLAYRIEKETGKHFIGVDVHPQSRAFIPIVKCDGARLPFENNSFDCVIIIDVLHHDSNPNNIIKEAKRVTKKYILIKDHYWKNKFDLKLLKTFDYISNFPYGISLPYNYIQTERWNKLFEQNNLKVVIMKKFRYSLFDLCKHVIFKLEKIREKT